MQRIVISDTDVFSSEEAQRVIKSAITAILAFARADRCINLDSSEIKQAFYGSNDGIPYVRAELKCNEIASVLESYFTDSADNHLSFLEDGDDMTVKVIFSYSLAAGDIKIELFAGDELIDQFIIVDNKQCKCIDGKLVSA